VGSLVEELVGALGAGKVSTETALLARYAVDQAPVLDFQLPEAVVFAGSVAEVQAVVRLCAAHSVAVVARGAGTGVSGGAHASRNCVVLSLERMNRILDLNPDDETAVVEPGVVNAALNEAAAEHGLMYAPDPASFRSSTIGGNVATNAGGLRCAKYGVTRDSVLALDVVLADGSLIHTGHQTFKGVAGYDLTGLFVGSEGTLGIVVGATVRLKYLPREVHTIAAFYPDFRQAAAGVLAVGRARVQPAIMELLDGGTLAQLDELHGSDLSARGRSLLLIQTDGFGAAAEADVVRSVLAAGGGIVYMLLYNSSNPALTVPEFTLTLLLMVVIGGAGSRWGAALGGILYHFLDDRLTAMGSSSTIQGLPSVLRTPLEQPLFLLGTVFILIVVFLPGGLAGIAARGRPSGLRRLEDAVRTTPALTEPQEEA